MRARVVIGANFGDEGKGLMTDYLCAREGAGTVVRFNGGAQAGHTVVTPDGARHVFQHVGSGAFCGVPTFLSRFFVANPLMFFKEMDTLKTVMDTPPLVFADPQCLVTTFADMVINQRKEDARGVKRHGSVGLGMHETLQRSQVPELRITMADLWNGGASLKDRMAEICGRWAKFRSGSPIADADGMISAFLAGCEKFAESVHPAGIAQCKDPVFEGAQGLLLDQDCKEYWPHVTHSKTGMHNVRLLSAQAGIDTIDAYYVSRTYLTRHGAGPLPGEDDSIQHADDTNLPHAYQGQLRFARLDQAALRKRCTDDFGSSDFKLVMTHFDQQPTSMSSEFRSYGPTRADVERC